MNFLKQYITVGPSFDIDYVLDKIIDTSDKKLSKTKFIVNDNEYIVKMNSKRYITFKNSIECCVCGTKGSYFLLQQQKWNPIKNNTAHFNLFAEDVFYLNNGEIILMTADHIIPLSKGGPDNKSNLITMCSICNNAKGNIF